MGIYLNMQGNDKGSIITGTARQRKLRARNPPVVFHRPEPAVAGWHAVLNSQGNLVPTYNQNVISGFASAFTGWNYYQTNQANGRLPTSFNPPANYTNPMVLVPTHHDLGTKLLLDNVVLPAALGSQTNSTQHEF